MAIADSTITFIGILEGKRYVSYKDKAGNWTIGIGHKINLKTEAGLLSQALNEIQVSALLKNDLVPVDTIIHSLVKVPLSQNEYDALAAFVFNVGVNGFASSTLLKAINSGAKQDYITSWWICWDKEHVDGVLVEDPGLKNRRQKEIDMYFTNA